MVKVFFSFPFISVTKKARHNLVSGVYLTFAIYFWKGVDSMGCLGNLLWFVCGGCISGLSWVLTGCLWCITIIGIPVGKQCFKFAALSFFPFGKDILNVIWLLVSGFWLAVESALIGTLLCITLIGIPFGLQHFKLARLALMPFGSNVYTTF